MLERPRRLAPGSRVAVISPSSAAMAPSGMHQGIERLEEWGMEVTVMPNVGRVRGYLAGSDRRRADDLLAALGDPSFDAVWCVRGGYGAQRTVAQLTPADIDHLRTVSPKALIGYSDTTVLHSLVSRSLGWASFYGPDLLEVGSLDDFGVGMLRAALFEVEPWEVGADPERRWMSTVVGGKATGTLAGGCLSLLAATVGTELQTDFSGKIAFFEDVDEAVYRIDGYLCQLLAAGCFEGCLGVAIGDLTRITMPQNSLGLEHVFNELLVPLGIPTCHYFPFGHGTHQATLPIGTEATLDADAGLLLIQPAVS